MGRPVLFVLAGVNGAGQSSVGGQVLVQAGLDGFKPDSVARTLTPCPLPARPDGNTTAASPAVFRARSGAANIEQGFLPSRPLTKALAAALGGEDARRL